MKRLTLVVPSILIMLAFTVFSSSGALAAGGGPPPILGYHVEVQMLHCINKFVPCNTPQTAANSLYTQVEVDKFAPGKTHGTPDAVVLVCGRAYFDKNNNFHDVGIHVFAGFDPGTITGNASGTTHRTQVGFGYVNCNTTSS